MPTSEQVFQKIIDLGLEMPPPSQPNGLYDVVTIHNGIAYTSGQLSRLDNKGNLVSGRVGADDALDEAVWAAKVCLLRGVGALHEALGDLLRIEKFLFIRGFINADPNFSRHSQVLDSVSLTTIELFGPLIGTHSRSALGACSLPSRGLVEIEFTVALKN